MYCQYCQRSTLFDDPRDEYELKSGIPEGTRRFRQQYLNENTDQSSSQPTTSFFERRDFSSTASVFSGLGSSSTGLIITPLFAPPTNGLPTEDVPRSLSPPQIQLQHHGSILLRAYSKQIHPQ
jgi:hypothetical protein